MPSRSPAALVASLVLLTAAVLISTAPARAAAFVDSAGRRVMLPDRIGRIMPAEPNAEVLEYRAGAGAARRGEPGPRARLPPAARHAPLARRLGFEGDPGEDGRGSAASCGPT